MVLVDDRLIAAAVHYDDRQGDVWPGSVKLFALDATTGRQLWVVDSFVENPKQEDEANGPDSCDDRVGKRQGKMKKRSRMW